MKNKLIKFLSFLLAVLCLSGCTPAEPSETQPPTEATTPPTEETHWWDHPEEMSMESRTTLLQEHLAENRDILEAIALGMLEAEKLYTDGSLCARDGVLYLQSESTPVFDYTNPIKSDVAELIGDYYERSPLQCQAIYISSREHMMDTELCMFDYGRYIDDGVPYDAYIIYCVEPGVEAKEVGGPWRFVVIDEHWQIFIEDYGWEISPDG